MCVVNLYVVCMYLYVVCLQGMYVHKHCACIDI